MSEKEMTPEDRGKLLGEIAAITESDLILHFKECKNQSDIVHNLRDMNYLLYKFALNYIGTLDVKSIAALLAHKLSSDVGNVIMTDDDFLSFLRSHDIIVETKIKK